MDKQFDFTLSYCLTQASKMGRLGLAIGGVCGLALLALGLGLGFGAFPSVIEMQVESNLNFWDENSEGRKNFVSTKGCVIC